MAQDKRQQQNQPTGKVVYLPHEHTEEMHQLFLLGVRKLNDLIDEMELRKREVEQDKEVISSAESSKTF